MTEKNQSYLDQLNLIFNRLESSGVNPTLIATARAHVEKVGYSNFRLLKAIPEAYEKFCFNSSFGVKADIDLVDERINNFTINNKKLIFDGDWYTDVHFAPQGRISFNPSRITDSLMMGAYGLTELLEAIDKKRFDAPSPLIGETNLRMASILQRLGFVFADQNFDNDRQLNESLKIFTVVGEIDDIRRYLEEFKNSTDFQRLTLRHQRLRLQTNPTVI